MNSSSIWAVFCNRYIQMVIEEFFKRDIVNGWHVLAIVILCNSQCCQQNSVKFFNFFKFYLFLERWERKEKKRNINVWLPLIHPYWGRVLQPKHVPWLGIELVTLWFTGQHLIHRATPARASTLIFKLLE